ncbi:MAG: DUF2628 domain-containing protein [Clostridiales bacterium]|uniref:zinc-ribbon domain-containing protein n=1 Tax=Terrisporobacter sp. TaxID=1965305 RepID=UPI002A50E4EA|nr:zinc-ribbon domain-containing protein [Terrisporobacter sp.]MDD7756442.1 DUF2628 domain-containing protein [Clostridiales bacterium]MDY4136771.1 DUF2628 domain-containing protein [Terrisporobacter sp.]
MENSILCSKCGASNEAGSAFCTKCGNSLAKTEVVDHISNNESYTQDELSLFLEKNQSYYLEKFNLIEKTGDKKAWNWCSFLIGGYWMLYRKMYVQAIIYIIANLILGCIPFIGWALSLALCVGLGIFGNSLYLDHIKKTFTEIGCADSNMRSTLINKKGGTNLVLPILLAVIPVIIGIIASIFIGVMGSMSYYYY